MKFSELILKKWILYIRTYFAIIFFAWAGLNQSIAQNISALDQQYDQAVNLYQQGAYVLARQAFSKAKSEPYVESATYFEASSAIKAGQNDGEYLVKQFVDRYPKHIYAQVAYLDLGNYYFDHGLYDKAAPSYEKVKGDIPLQVHFNKGYAHFQLEQYELALASFAKLDLSNDPLETDAAYFQGFILYRQGDLKSANKHLESAFESKNYGLSAVELYVSLLYQEKKYSQVIKAIEARGESVIKNPMILNFLADSHYALKKYDKAEINYIKLLKDCNKCRNEFNYYKSGYSSYQLEHKTEAIESLKRAAVADDTVGAYASYYLGVMYFQQPNYPFAMTSFANTTKYKTKLKEEALYYQARTLLAMEKFQEAIKVLQTYNHEYPKGKYRADSDEQLIMAYTQTNDYDMAMRYFEELATVSNAGKQTYQRVTFLKGTALFNEKKFKEAAVVFEKSLIYNVDIKITQQAYYWMGETLSLLDREQESLLYYRSVSRNFEKSIYLKALYGGAYANFNLKDYESAIEGFSQFLGAYDGTINKNYQSDALMRLADAHFAMKNYEKGIANYQKALESGNKDIGQIYFQIGLLNRYLNRYEEAKKYYNKLISEVPDSPRLDHAIFQIGQLELEKGKDALAIASFGKLIEEHPTSEFLPFALLSQAVAYSNSKQVDNCIANYKEVLQRFPRHETAKSALLGLQNQSANGVFNDFDQYLAMYKKANPNSEALENIEFESAKLHYYNQNYNQALKSLAAFIASYPKSAFVVESHYLMGDAYYRSNDFSTALKEFYSIEKDKDFSKYSRVIHRIAELEGLSKKYEKSIEYYQRLGKSTSSARDQAIVDQGLMENFFALNQYDSAKIYGKALLKSSKVSITSEAIANLILGKCEYIAKNYESANTYFMTLVTNVPDERGAEAYYYVCRILFDRGLNDKALESLFKMTNAVKNYEVWQGKAYLLMADIYIKTDEIFQAKATLNSLIENVSDKEIVKNAKEKLASIKEVNTVQTNVSHEK